MARRRGSRWTASGYSRALGRKIHLGTFATRREAEQAEARHKLQGRPTGQETCDAFAARWTRDYPRPRESTNVTNAQGVKRFSRDFAGVKLADVDRPAARAWIVKHPSNLNAVRSMFGDARRDGLIEHNPFSDLRLPQSRGRRDIVALTEAQLRDVADRAPVVLPGYGVSYRAAILFAGYTGVRPGELFALRRDDIVGAHVHVERSLSAQTATVGPTKNGHARTIVVPPPALAALAEVPPHPDGLLFAGPSGRMLTRPTNHRLWGLVRANAARPTMDFYVLRHTAATLFLERGATPWQVAHQLGHRDGGALVMSRYGHPAEAGMRAALLAVWDHDDDSPARVSGAGREQAS